MYSVRTLNKIAPIGLLKLPTEQFVHDHDAANPDAILVRSASMHDMPLEQNLLCISRAGAGVNNIPIAQCSQKGIVVFNTPGANANAVRELAVCAIFLSSRDIVGGINWSRSLTGDDVPAQVEKGKSQFIGPEALGKTLGVIGLGAIGSGVANAAHHLGMDVLGYDPYISVDSAWGLSRNVRRARDIKQVFAESDYISLHVPMNKESQAILSDMLDLVKPGVRLINLSRGELLDSAAVLSALDRNVLACYVTDFPNAALVAHPRVVPIPHLGASTPESEDNCAVMACEQMREYLLHGNIMNSVNLPNVELPPASGFRLCVLHRNIPHMLSEISQSMAEHGINIENMVNKSRDEYAYTLLDIASLPGEAAVARLRANEGILRVRVIKI